MLNKQEISLPETLHAQFEELATRFEEEDVAARIWKKDSRVWTGSDESNWLGWLDILDAELKDAEKYLKFAEAVGEKEFSNIVLLGMGGSSLCPEVLALTFGKDSFRILDSTVPDQVRSLRESIDVEKTLFIVASKSGSTLEPNAFMHYFYNELEEKIGDGAAKQFVAITDPGSKLEAHANDKGFWKVFHGKPSVGGRFSALSVFGLIPAAAMGIDVKSFLSSAKEMQDACRDKDVIANPGGMLGVVLGVAHQAGRDKLTIFTSPEIQNIGAWMEQLIAESTGKEGVAIIPVDREVQQEPATYKDDRIFALLSLGDDKDLKLLREGLQECGHPVIDISMESVEGISQEFFRWEFATAIAGAAMKINPFDQPDVEAAKIEARKITDEYERTGELPLQKPFIDTDSFSLWGDSQVTTFGGAREHVRQVLRYHLNRIAPGDYFALIGYIEMNEENQGLFAKIRKRVMSKYNVATCVGFGPRFLHSTGQAYKGGADNGVFLQITTETAGDIDVPGHGFSFEVIKEAQSRGDFQVLVDRGKRALRIHLKNGSEAGLERILELI